MIDLSLESTILNTYIIRKTPFKHMTILKILYSKPPF